MLEAISRTNTGGPHYDILFALLGALGGWILTAKAAKRREKDF